MVNNPQPGASSFHGEIGAGHSQAYAIADSFHQLEMDLIYLYTDKTDDATWGKAFDHLRAAKNLVAKAMPSESLEQCPPPSN